MSNYRRRLRKVVRGAAAYRNQRKAALKRSMHLEPLEDRRVLAAIGEELAGVYEGG